VSAHVVPKAPPFPSEDEDEKTTIESGWEEEASTTVEQGDVADKIRALGLGVEQPRRPNTNITSTNGSGMSEEPTADDQRGAAALAMLPPPMVARLVITQGNDSGQALEVRPGKTYTIGRGVDNDLVLSDIAVSRKHFDVRHERGSWVLADRGSGNGTLVNNRIEDAPFTLASGDVIEIGNTSFRFDLPNGAPRVQSSYDVPVDDDLELSTMAGKPLLEAEPATPHHLANPGGGPGRGPAGGPISAPIMLSAKPAPVAPLAPAVAPAVPSIMSPVGAPTGRPKTLPPPATLRPRTPSNRPPVGYALDRPGPQSGSQPPPGAPPSILASLAPTMSPVHGMQPPPASLPLPQMANRPQMPRPALLDLQNGLQNGPQNHAMPATLPGQGAPMQPAHPARLPFAYPSAAELPHQHAPVGGHGQPMVVASGQPGRDATSTALVQPMSYSNGPPAVIVPQPVYSPPPQMSRRMKLVLGGAGLALFAAVTTIAVVSGSSGEPVPSDGADIAPPRPVVAPSRPTVEPIRESRTAKSSAPAVPKPDKDKALPPTAPVPKPDKLTTAPPVTTPPITTTPVTTPPAATPPSAARTDKLATTTTTPPTTAPPIEARIDKPATPPPALPPAADKVEVAANRPDTKAPKPDAVAVAANRADKRTPKRPDKKPTPVTRVEANKPPKVEVAAPTAPKADKKRGGRSTQDVKNDADGLYRAKRFSDAAALVTAALPGFSGGDSQDLKSIAATYSQLGKAYNVGMAPGTKATDAFVALQRARNYDRSVGSAYVAEIERVLVTVASKAALSYAAAKDYESAFQAVRSSESLGSTSPTNKSIREKLEDLAAELYRSASGELATDPDGAKKKLRQVLGMVDTKSPLYGKASKLLNGS
jgi:hypothetical protein